MSTQPPASREHPSIEELTGQSDAEREARWSRYDWQLLPSTPLDPVIQIALD